MSMKTPVRYPVKFYSYKDDEAISLQDADGCIKTIIKSCLVTGYGTKESAGWTMPFEDDFRMILRRPLRTGNPPDIRIENGPIDGAASHRIVGLDNATAIDDSNECGAVNLLARSNKAGQQWYLMATDFGFVMFYEMAENYYNSTNIMHLQYVGDMMNIFDDESNSFCLSRANNINKNGYGNTWMREVFSTYSSNGGFYTLREKKRYAADFYSSMTGQEMINNAYVAQPIIVGGKFIAPFMTSLGKNAQTQDWGEVIIDNRKFFRCQNRYVQNYDGRVVYVPLDYWEL